MHFLVLTKLDSSWRQGVCLIHTYKILKPAILFCKHKNLKKYLKKKDSWMDICIIASNSGFDVQTGDGD